MSKTDRNQPFQIPSLNPPLPRCYWVLQDQLLAGAYPGHVDPAKHAERICGLFDAGMRTFINLTEENESNKSQVPFARYDPLLRELASSVGEHVSHLRFPIPDAGTTSRDRMRSVLDAMDLSFQHKVSVFVHCYGGMGRTGTVICCWLLRHGLATKETIFGLLDTLRQADKERASWPAPENEIQRQFVREWSE